MGSRIGTYNVSERQTLDHFEKILNKYDLESLIKMGAPDDEYSSEAEQILYRISKQEDGVSIEEVAKIVEDVFRDYFGGPTRNRKYNPFKVIFLSYDVWLIIERLK